MLTVRPRASRVISVACPAPVMPGIWLTTNGPGGTLPENCCTPLMYSDTDDGTTDEELNDDTGKVTRSGRSAKFLPHWMPATRTERDQFSDDVIVSPRRRVCRVSWSECDQYVS
ncbi:hypothetical protein D3C72_1252550 [compost metagenome]